MADKKIFTFKQTLLIFLIYIVLFFFIVVGIKSHILYNYKYSHEEHQWTEKLKLKYECFEESLIEMFRE